MSTSLTDLSHCAEPVAHALSKVELQMAKVTTVESRRHRYDTEPEDFVPPLEIKGELSLNGNVVFSLYRQNRRWEVEGEVPLYVAQEIHCGQLVAEIRANGKMPGVDPKFAAVYLQRELLSMGQKIGIIPHTAEVYSVTREEEQQIIDKSPDQLREYVLSYSIDSQEALNYFVELLRRCNLVD